MCVSDCYALNEHGGSKASQGNSVAICYKCIYPLYSDVFPHIDKCNKDEIVHSIF